VFFPVGALRFFFRPAPFLLSPQGQEAFVLINIANEPFGNVANMTAWADATRYALVRLRGGGITHTLMVDAPNWGQDWAGEMRTHARELFAADPLRNTVFSVHMYEVS